MLLEKNPTARRDVIEMYASVYVDWLESCENIEKNGNIVLHPRTGAPVVNPYIEIKTRSMTSLLKLKEANYFDADCLWAAVQ